MIAVRRCIQTNITLSTGVKSHLPPSTLLLTLLLMTAVSIAFYRANLHCCYCYYAVIYSSGSPTPQGCQRLLLQLVVPPYEALIQEETHPVEEATLDDVELIDEDTNEELELGKKVKRGSTEY